MSESLKVPCHHSFVQFELSIGALILAEELQSAVMAPKSHPGPLRTGVIVSAVSPIGTPGD